MDADFKFQPPALPTSVTDLLALRKIMIRPDINNYVDEIHVHLWAEPKYQRLLDAIWDSDAVEGALAADDYSAAHMIRDYAHENGITFVAEKNLATILHALKVVLRRYGISRNERRNYGKGQPVSEAAE